MKISQEKIERYRVLLLVSLSLETGGYLSSSAPTSDTISDFLDEKSSSQQLSRLPGIIKSKYMLTKSTGMDI